MVRLLTFCLLLFSGNGFESQLPGEDKWVECNTQYPSCYTCTIQYPNLLENGNFEDYPMSVIAYSFPTTDGSPIYGWQKQNPGFIEIVKGSYPGTCALVGGGAQFAELDPAGPSDEMYQDIITIPGKLYEVSFWHSWRDSISPTTSRLEVWVNGSLIKTAERESGQSCTWTQHKAEFTGAGPTRLSLVSPSGSGDYGPDVDNVEVYLKDPQFQYHIIYYMITDESCPLCNSSFGTLPSCRTASSATPVAECYGYLKDQLIPTYCWSQQSKYSPHN